MTYHPRMIRRFRVWIHSVPGPMAQYQGHVDVAASNSESAKVQAMLKLKDTYPDRGNSCWRVEKVEVL